MAPQLTQHSVKCPGAAVRLNKVVLASAAFLCFAPPAHAQSFNQFWAFGDSTTDTGWFAHASTGDTAIDALVKNALAAGGNAHFTGPGQGNAQILAGFFGLSANAANTPGGTNYAIGGAFDDSVLGPGFQNLFTGLSGPNPSLPSTATQIHNYLASVSGHANANALYLIGSGGNDATVAELIFGTNTAKANVFLVGEAGALVNSISLLKAAGAHYIVVTDEYIPPSAGATTIAYGKTLVAATWGGLAAAGVNFIPADTFSVIAAVEKNPLAFGITAPITSNACIAPTGWTLGSGYGFLCAPTTKPPPAGTDYGYLVSADATRTHLFMDSTHLTEAGQQIVADYIYSLIVAPSQMSFLGETAIRTTFQTIVGIQQQIALAERYRAPGWNVWMNGDLSYLKINNSFNGFPGDPGLPVSGTAGVDYKWSNGWLVGAAFTLGYVNPTFSLGGGYTQDSGSVSFYTGYRNYDLWGDLIGTVGLLHDTTNRQVPIGITVQPNNGATSGLDLSLAAEIGYDFHAGPVTHGPVAGFILQQARINGFTESGSFTSLSFATQARNSEVSALGYQARLDWGILHPFAQVAWDHEFDSLNRVVTAFLTTTSAPSYSMPAVVLGRDWATATVGTNVTFNRSWSGVVSFTAQLGQEHAIVYGGLIGIDYSFGQDPPAPAILIK
jgi:outer membrane lipase/esterase